MKRHRSSVLLKSKWQVAEIKVIYQANPRAIAPVKVNSSNEAEQVFRANWSNDIELVEEFNVLFLNRANYVKGILRLSRGGITGTVVDPRVMFASALKGLAVALIVAHNHPSGLIKPSSKDLELTRRLRDIGKIHDIEIVDHIILAPGSGFYSFADEGNL